ncbi:CRE-SULP-5 protein [Aphelenchoides avenae]|nr:CRE-SULP-5 protein [Aphelenchus avenae]
MSSFSLAVSLDDPVKNDRIADEIDTGDFILLGSKRRSLFRAGVRRYCLPCLSSKNFFNSLVGFLPILRWLPQYKWREDFLMDFCSGFTTGVLFVPQGIAYAYLAGVSPANGLYSSFFAPLFYVLLGTSMHVSRGPSSVLGIMSGLSNDQIRASYGSSFVGSGMNSTMDAVDPVTTAATLTFTIGLLQLLMAVLKLEFLSDYFSDALVSGFTAAAAVHTLISQLDDLLGIRVPRFSGPGYLFPLLLKLIERLLETNLVTAGISIFSVVFLVFGKDVITPIVNRLSPIRFTVPHELFVMVIAAVFSNAFDWADNDGVKVVGEVPRGMPEPSLPMLSLIPYCVPNALAIAVVTLAMHFSMTKMLATRMHYSVDNSQELYAIALGSTFSGFFPVYPTSTALGRTMVMVESGARTQLSSVVSCSLLLAVILWLGPYFRPLPQCVLSAVIVVSLRPIFRKFSELPQIWKVSKHDFFIWISCFVGTVLTDVISGLGISLAFALISVVLRVQWPRWSARFPKSTKLADYCVYRFESTLLFANIERFKKSILEANQQWLAQRKSLIGVNIEALEDPAKKRPRTFIVDCAAITQIDCMGVAALRETLGEICADGADTHVRVYFASANEDVAGVLIETKITESRDLFDSVAEAVAIAESQSADSGADAAA